MKDGSFARLAVGFVGLCMGAGVAVGEEPQAPQRLAAAEASDLQEVVVTGYRRSLEEAAAAKRDAIGIQDSIFAEDIGKFPDTNIAESFNRIPGIQITRDVTGEGVNVAIRGLGTNFTRVLLNGAPVAVASSGITDAQSSNREVDLNMFPTELFTQLTVRKTSSASMLEGGAAGTVDMRSARPFDAPGEHLTYSVQGTSNQNAGPWGERGSLLASRTWDTFGVLIGGVGVHDQVNTPGFETIGWTNPHLTAAQCGAGNTCNTTGGGNWTIPSTVPAGAGNGLTPGTTIDEAFLLAHNPGLTLQQINNAIIPRLGRPADETGTKDRYNGILSLEAKPTDALHLYVDSLYGKEQNDLIRQDMNWIGRNGAMIPLNMQVDSDCATGCVVKSATYANSQFFLEYRPYKETTDFWGVNPGVDWQVADDWKINLRANRTHSTFHREVPSFDVTTPLGSGLTVNYTNNGGIPSISSNVDLNNPANFGWNTGARVNIQDERRTTDTKGARLDVTWGKGGPINVNVGGAYDDVSRKILGFDNSLAWENAVCGDNPNVFVPTPNSEPPCQGLATPTPGAGYPTYPGLGTGYSAGVTSPLVYQGSLIPNAAVPAYLKPGPGFATVDWNKVAAAAQYAAFHAAEPPSGGANTGAGAGSIEEKTLGIYTELSGDLTVAGNRLRYTGGVRWVRTQQLVGGYTNIANPLNALLADGAKFPNLLNPVEVDRTYYNTLPSAELAYDVSASAVVRAAVSSTLTRPNPSDMLPGLNFGGPSADVGTVGNASLKPYISQNLDLGFEYYTGKEGYWGVTAFRKRITGFTTNGNTTVPFSSLAAYGVTFDTLSPTQQGAINARGGPNVATVVLQQQVNASGVLTINGLEADWVQPLDFLLGRFGLDGFGFAANYTLIDQFGTGAAPAVAQGVAPHSYNVSAYYEKGAVSARISTVYNKGSQIANPNQNGIPLAALFADDYRQWDFSSSLDLSKLLHWTKAFQVTFDVINLFDARQRTYFQFTNATFTEYNPGRELLIGVRGQF